MPNCLIKNVYWNELHLWKLGVDCKNRSKQLKFVFPCPVLTLYMGKILKPTINTTYQVRMQFTTDQLICSVNAKQTVAIFFFGGGALLHDLTSDNLLAFLA